MKICVLTNDKKRKIYLPNAILTMRPVINRLIREAKIEISEEKIEIITDKITQYVMEHKRQCIIDVDVLSSEQEYVHVEIYL